MLYLLHGTDNQKARTKAHELIDALHKKKPDAELFSLNAENWSAARFEELIGGQGLFENKYIVFADDLLSDDERAEIVFSKLVELKTSANVFIFLELELDKKTVGKFEKYAEKIQVFDVPKVAKREEFNIFSLGDALGARDKKSLWVLYQKAKMSGLEDEQIHGTLFWMVKSILLSAQSKSATEAGISPFVYGKAVRYAKNYSADELFSLSSRLVSLYHESRRGGLGIDLALEKFILTI